MELPGSSVNLSKSKWGKGHMACILAPFWNLVQPAGSFCTLRAVHSLHMCSGWSKLGTRAERCSAVITLFIRVSSPAACGMLLH